MQCSLGGVASHPGGVDGAAAAYPRANKKRKQKTQALTRTGSAANSGRAVGTCGACAMIGQVFVANAHVRSRLMYCVYGCCWKGRARLSFRNLDARNGPVFDGGCMRDAIGLLIFVCNLSLGGFVLFNI